MITITNMFFVPPQPPSLSRSDAVLLSRLATSGFATVVLDSQSGSRSEVKDHDMMVWDCYANAVEVEKTRTIQSIISILYLCHCRWRR
ncbi:unnamed protein product [Linum trigynum]|uniref:Uncharacterized protein n=1 Tax=Linum trigynum TaxID=586398 RepID=A0AAV2FXK5_9ROSI